MDRYRSELIALIAVAAAGGLRVVAEPFVGDTQVWLTFWPAMFLAAWYGGPRAGLEALGLSIAFIAIWFAGTEYFDLSRALVGGSAFVACGAGFCFVVARHRRVRDAERRAAKRHEALVDLASVLAGASSIEDVAHAVVTEGLRTARADTAMLYVHEETSHAFRLVTERNCAPEVVAKLRVIEAASDHGTKFQTEQWVSAREDYVSVLPQVAAIPSESRRAESWWSMPLEVEGKCIGVLAMGFFEPRRYDDGEREFVRLFARQCAQALARVERTATAEAANRAKDEFLAMLGHELRNPLAPITTALELIDMQGLDRAPKALEILRRQVTHMTRMVDDLLDVSRIIAGKIQLVKRRIELREVVTRAIEIASPLLEERRHTLHVDVPDVCPLDADVTRLTQVVSNILTNAAKYTDPGGRIEIAARLDDDHVVLEIRDNGVGVDAALLPRIFDLFTQEAQSAARSRGGLGLGLAIARTLVQLHGGTLSASSEGRGRGATLHVQLPRATVSPRVTEPRLAASPEAATRRVLVVDDNADAAEMLTALVELRGHTTRHAIDAASALALLDEFSPDVALLDLGLPVMDGFELARRIREHPRYRGIRLVAVTGYGQPGDRVRSSDAGFDLHLVKPVHVADVFNAIEHPPGG